MFRKTASHLKEFMCIQIPGCNEKEFTDGINRINVERARLTSLLFIFIETALLVFSAVVYNSSFLRTPRLCYSLMYCIMLFTMLIFYSAFRRVGKDVAVHEAEIRVLGAVFTTFILCWCAGIATLDQIASGQILVYVFAVIAVSVMPYFKPSVILGIFLFVHVVFISLLIFASQPAKIPFGNIINSTTFVVIAWAVSAMRFKKQAMAYSSRKLIEQKNAELNRINLELQEANEKLRILSRVDGVTGIFNRTVFDDSIRSEWERCGRQSLPLTLFMIDIDFFKGYNDHYGHQAGDECLRRIAGALSSSARRTSDVAARYGGEEFALILPYMKKMDAELFSRQIVGRVEALKIPYEYSSVASCVTISLGGCTVVPDTDGSVEDLIGKADRALYEAKKQRNRAEIFAE